jgi:hypothetical protein
MAGLSEPSAIALAAKVTRSVTQETKVDTSCRLPVQDHHSDELIRRYLIIKYSQDNKSINLILCNRVEIANE